MKLYKNRKSNIHRHGLSAATEIKKGQKIIQYKGKKVSLSKVETNPKYDNEKEIYLFDNTYHKIFKICIQELVYKKLFETLINTIKYLKYKPLFILPKYFIRKTSNSIIFFYKR